MATPTKAQWDEVRLKLSGPYGSAYFKCDDYLINAEVSQSKMKLIIGVYVNGWIKGKWYWTGNERDISNMSDIARRFYCLRYKRGINDRFCYASPQFNTPGAFITHLKKHNPSIEVLDYPTYQKGLDALPIDKDEIASATALGEEHA